jgi:hypothetical protein
MNRTRISPMRQTPFRASLQRLQLVRNNAIDTPVPERSRHLSGTSNRLNFQLGLQTNSAVVRRQPDQPPALHRSNRIQERSSSSSSNSFDPRSQPFDSRNFYHQSPPQLQRVGLAQNSDQIRLGSNNQRSHNPFLLQVRRGENRVQRRPINFPERGVYSRNALNPVSDVLREEGESDSMADPFQNLDIDGPFAHMNYFDNQEDSILGSQHQDTLNDESERFFLD